MKTKYFLTLIFITMVFTSCDILRLNRFEISSWSPYEEYHADPEKITVWLDFSHEPDRASVEKNFLLYANESVVKGNFTWEGKKMTFIPLHPYEINTDYTVNLSSDAHDKKGFSMDDDFYFEFTTRKDRTRPVLLSSYPANYEVIEDQKTEIILVFSTPVPLTALYGSVSTTPSMNGSWRLEDNNTKAVFTPLENWTYGARYEIRFSASLENIYGMNISSDFSSVFTVGTDNEEPFLLYAQRIAKNGDVINLNENFVNAGWEKEDKLKIIFNEPVEMITVKNNLTVIPESEHNVSSLIMETSPFETENGFIEEFVFKFDNYPVYASQFRIQINPGIKDKNGNESKNESTFRIIADSPDSRPPLLIGFRMPVSLQNEEDEEDEEAEEVKKEAVYFLFAADTESNFPIMEMSEGLYPPSVSVPVWIELYFDAAGSINIFSLMELFRVETSNLVLSFSPRLVKTENFSIPEPHTGWENYERIEIMGILTNSTNYGVIYIQIGAGLLDSLDNKNEKLQRISVIK